MANYVMSDIHGELDLFNQMLELIQFSEHDTLYIIGDVVDRGPCGITLLQKIMHTSNMFMLLGNHEYMMLQYMNPNATDADIRRWNRNGNEPTLEEFRRMDESSQKKILNFLRALPTHLEVTASGTRFYLVHAFPAENVYDEVWERPTLEHSTGLPEYQVIIGHTPVVSLQFPKEQRDEVLSDMAARGEHMKICHANGFIDIDCGCGYDIPYKTLACLRLEDMEEFYVRPDPSLSFA